MYSAYWRIVMCIIAFSVFVQSVYCVLSCVSVYLVHDYMPRIEIIMCISAFSALV